MTMGKVLPAKGTEGLEVGVGGGDPVGADGLGDEVQLGPAHVRRRKVDARRGSASGRRREGNHGSREVDVVGQAGVRGPLEEPEQSGALLRA